MALRRMAGSCSNLLLHARVASADVPAAVQLVSVAVFRWDHFNNRSSRNVYWPHNNVYGDVFAHSFATKTGPQSDKQLISELPDAKDCDEVLGDYDSLRIKYAKIGYPPTYKPWTSRVAEFSRAAGRFTLSAVHFVVMVPSYVFRAITMPGAERSAKLALIWKTIKHEAHHYWMGTKVLAYEVRIAAGLATKALGNDKLTRRERRQLTRTVADLFRLVPMMIILLIPFLELLLPVLLRVFPNMLPSTFEDKLKKEEQLKKQLVVKLELARFLQDTVAEMAQDIIKSDHGGAASATAADLVQFMSKVRAGEVVTSDELLKFAPLFKDELTLDNLSRMQLVSICQFVGLTPFGTDAFLRSRLRAHLDKIKADDHAIKEEGLESLSQDELRAACRDRGLRAPFGEGAVAFMRRQLEDWLKLSLQRNLPSSLLLLSRAFTITTNIYGPQTAKQAEHLASIRDTLGVLPDDVVEEVELQALSQQPSASAAEALKNKLELLKREQELIAEEAQERKKASEKAAAAQALSSSQVLVTHPGLLDAKMLAGSAAPGALLGDSVVQATRQALANEGLSEEEIAARLEAVKEARLKDTVAALTVLASSSGVAKERALFMELVKKEIDRVNQVVAQRGTSQLVFSSGSLQANHVDDQAPELVGASKALAARVDRIIHQLEAELDSVEEAIGGKLHMLDVDKDGLISREELEGAVRFLKEQIGEEELKALLDRLNVANDGQLHVKELLAIASDAPAPSPLSKAKAKASSSSGSSGSGGSSSQA